MVVHIKVVLAIPDFPKESEAPKYIIKESRSRPGTAPLGLLTMIAYLEKNGVEMELIDNFVLRLPSMEFAKSIAEMNPSLVGFSTNSFTYPQGRDNMKDLKSLLPDVPIIVGGVHATLFPMEVAKEPFVDYVCRGEGEQTLLELVQALERGETPENVKGLVFRKSDGTSHVCEERPFINLDDLPFPDRHIKNFKDYTRGKVTYMNVEPIDMISSSRGCPFNCNFCSSKTLWKRSYRVRSVKNVVDEIEELINVYGSKGLYFREDNFTVNKQRTMELCAEINRRGIRIPWVCESRVDLLSEELLVAMKAAGCQGIWFGVESGSQRILDYVNKGIKLEDVEKCIKLCKKHGVKTGASFIIGLPVETREDVQKSFEFAKKLNCDSTWFNQFIGMPNCKIYMEIKEGKYYIDDWNGLLAVQTPYFTFEELLDIETKINSYFKVKRWKSLLLVTKPTKLISNLPGIAKMVKTALFDPPFKRGP
jgi:anaerobic magnesium-protoporphyrin IX monomethyl ester cyclase